MVLSPIGYLGFLTSNSAVFIHTINIITYKINRFIHKSALFYKNISFLNVSVFKESVG